jgi:hypothetical protein
MAQIVPGPAVYYECGDQTACVCHCRRKENNGGELSYSLVPPRIKLNVSMDEHRRVDGLESG